jgi:hypothetical protein
MGQTNSIDDLAYHDSGFTIGELRTAERPFDLVLNGKLSARYLAPKGTFLPHRFSELTTDFFKYFVMQTYFDENSEVFPDLPSEGSSESIWAGDIYIRRFSPNSLLEELSDLDLPQIAPGENLAHTLSFLRNNQLIPPQIVDSLVDSIPFNLDLAETAQHYYQLIDNQPERNEVPALIVFSNKGPVLRTPNTPDSKDYLMLV